MIGSRPQQVITSQVPVNGDIFVVILVVINGIIIWVRVNIIDMALARGAISHRCSHQRPYSYHFMVLCGV